MKYQLPISLVRILVAGFACGCHSTSLLAGGSDWQSDVDQARKDWKAGRVAATYDNVDRAIAHIPPDFVDPNAITTLKNLAELCCIMHLDQRAQVVYLILLKAEQSESGSERDVAETLNSLGGVYLRQKNDVAAAPIFEQLVRTQEHLTGADGTDVAIALTSLGELYTRQGSYGKAEALLERALAIREKAHPTDESAVAMSLNNLATVYLKAVDYDKAAPLARRALIIGEKIFGPDDVRAIGILNTSAAIYVHQQQLDRGESLYKRVLEIKEKRTQTPEEQYDIADNLNNLAALYTSEGKYALAEPLYKQAVEARRIAGDEDPMVATALYNCAELNRLWGKYDAAEKYYKSSLNHFDKYQPNKASVEKINLLQRYAEVLRILKRPEDANDVIQRMDDMLRPHSNARSDELRHIPS